jgi:hypothetical protein
VHALGKFKGNKIKLKIMDRQTFLTESNFEGISIQNEQYMRPVPPKRLKTLHFTIKWPLINYIRIFPYFLNLPQI